MSERATEGEAASSASQGILREEIDEVEMEAADGTAEDGMGAGLAVDGMEVGMEVVSPGGAGVVAGRFPSDRQATAPAVAPAAASGAGGAGGGGGTGDARAAGSEAAATSSDGLVPGRDALAPLPHCLSADPRLSIRSRSRCCSSTCTSS